MFENHVNILGRLTREPELKTVNDNTKIMNFTVAVNRVNKNSDHPETDFIRCVAWNRTAELIDNYFSKGDRIGVSGRIQVRSYEDKDGNKREAVEVIAEEIGFIEKRKDNNQESSGSYSQPEKDDFDDDEEDLPL